MNTQQQEIESVLRAAPKPAPPPGLKEQLIAQVRLASASPHAQPSSLNPQRRPSASTASWLRRWWPVLVPASVSLACVTGLTLQQVEIHGLKRAIQDLPRTPVPAPAVNRTPSAQTISPQANASTDAEIARLKALASQLSAEVEQLEKMRTENAALRTKLAAPPDGFLTPEETEALAAARERAESIACVNNLKQLGLAVRVWALDNKDMTPPNVIDMTNEMGSAKILVCPGDKGHEAAKNWAAYSSANCSYEYLAPSAPDNEPTRVLFRCPIHGHVCLNDGSVQSAVAKKHPEMFVQRNGKLYLGEPSPPVQAAPPSTGNDAQRAFRRRYGLEGSERMAPTPPPPPAAEPPSPTDGSNQ
jgi:hypothetical protein